MRTLGLVVLTLPTCSGPPTTTSTNPSATQAANEEREPAGDARRAREASPEVLPSDTPKATSAGHTFIAPAGWCLSTRGHATIVTTPEGVSHIAFVDVQAADAGEAVAAAWAEYGRANLPPHGVVELRADENGWTDIHTFEYQVPPNEQRLLFAEARRVNDDWLVVLADASNADAEKRGAEFLVTLDRLYPKGYTPESFAGKTANRLDDARVAKLTEFIEAARAKLGVPGVSLGLVQDRRIMFLGGFGLRELGKPAKVDGDTKFMIASNTKPLTTLLLAKLVDEKRITWESPVTDLLPWFALGDPETTSKVHVEHLVCACTGIPGQNFMSTFEFGHLTPRKLVEMLATIEPTSEFGEVYQYSNEMAAAAGFIAGHVAYPKLELGEAYAKAMHSRVFGPLGMTATTFDDDRARRRNWARPHSPDVDGNVGPAIEKQTNTYDAPAGGAWSTARDILAYLEMELSEGLLPNGDRYLAKGPLLARREPQVAMGKDATYGMGLVVETKYDVTVVHHGGAVDGSYSDMLWLPEHGVGAVILTNGEPGRTIHEAFRRKLLEILFDGKPQADAAVTAAAKTFSERLAADRERLELPADENVVAGLAPRYFNSDLGELRVRRTKDKVVFDFGEWTSEVASSTDPDGTVSMVIIGLGSDRVDFVVGSAQGRRTLTLPAQQGGYVFIER